MSDDLPLFRFVEKPGSHAVGLRVVEQYDYSRVFRHLTDVSGAPYLGERARPLQTLLWYPAERVPRSMTVRDYTALWATETNFGHPKMAARSLESLQAMAPTLDSSLWAVRDATPAPGRFPVVIYAPSFSSTAWENADLCEYLASHGFVVLATPSFGVSTRCMTTDLAGLGAQAADISFLIGFARTIENADTSKVAVAGFSWGGLANVVAAARDNRIGALVALDGSLRYWPGLLKQAQDVQPEHMRVPLLSFAKAEWTLEEQARYLSPEQIDGPNVLNAWAHGDVFDVHMLGMTHRQFSSMFQRNEEVWRDFHDPQFPDRQKADYSREDGTTGYGWMARYTLEFLNAYLKASPQSMSYLKRSPAQNGVPRHFMEVNFRAARGTPVSFEAFREEIGRRGFDAVESIYAAPRKDDPEFSLAEVALNAWAEQLVDDDRLSEAIALLRLCVTLHPDSSSAHASLARVRQMRGEHVAAIEGYRTALAGNRVNPEAYRKLRDLEQATTGRGSRDESKRL